MANWRVMVVSSIFVSSASRNALERLIENTPPPTKGKYWIKLADPTGLASPSLYFLQILFFSIFSRIFLLK